LIFIVIFSHMTFKLRVLQLWQTHFASYEESTGSPVRGLFLIPLFAPNCVEKKPIYVFLYILQKIYLKLQQM